MFLLFSGVRMSEVGFSLLYAFFVGMINVNDSALVFIFDILCCSRDHAESTPQRVCSGRLSVNERHEKSVDLKSIYVNAKVAPSTPYEKHRFQVLDDVGATHV